MLVSLITLAVMLAAPLGIQASLLSITVEPSLQQGSTDATPFAPPGFKLHQGYFEGSVGSANYSDETHTNGWAYLEVSMLPGTPDATMVYAAGVLEGAISHEIIYNSWRNTMEGFCDWKGADYCKKLRVFVAKNKGWMNDMIREKGATSPLWYQVSLVLAQLHGVVDGYNSVAPHHISYEDFLWMNMQGDLEDLDNVFQDAPLGSQPAVVRGDGHCSALIKLLHGNTDLYASHVTWNSLQSMLRIQKKYILPIKALEFTPSGLVPGHTTTFSSYPGIVHSADDFYLLSSGLMTMETTIGNSNPDLWSNVTPEGELQEWIRVLVANRLAVGGHSWSKIFKSYNSGTYNNQWMILNYKLFTPLKMIRANTLWVLEQLPGMVVAKDMSHQLQATGYWASYNVPAFPSVFNESGLPALVEKYGDWFSYDKTPRALIFARDQGSVKDIGSMVKLMRYNDYKNDPLAKCDCDPPYSGENAISCRSDLNPINGTYPFGALGHRSHAGTDMKVTSYDMFDKKEFLAVAGPTYDQQPVFKWSTSDFAKDTAHYGHPDAFKFPLVQRQWS